MNRFVILLLAVLAACTSEPQPPLVASDVVVTRPMPGMKMSAAYLSLANNSDETIRITRVASAEYESVQMHETRMEDGVARMRAIPVLEIAAGETVTLQRGGKHLMLMRPTGSSDTVSLQFLDGDDLLLTVDATFEPQTN
ncbi:MAG: copper chaperone PCu(A)C [Gammaproteobacteria bacterium]|nr:copper chaperone PCu(A)C [Gammaproteobacteria bacterium]